MSFRIVCRACLFVSVASCDENGNLLSESEIDAIFHAAILEAGTVIETYEEAIEIQVEDVRYLCPVEPGECKEINMD